MSETETTLTIIPECFIYKVPPRTSVASYKAAEWGPQNFLWSGKLVVLEKGNDAIIRFIDSETGAVFAQSIYSEQNCEPVSDSSRYFVIKIEDEKGGRHAFVGMGFTDRQHSTEFKIALSDHVQRLRHTQHEAERRRSDETRPPLDLSLKKNISISVNLGSAQHQNSTSSGPSSTSTSPPPLFSTGSNGSLLPPPPSGRHKGRRNVQPTAQQTNSSFDIMSTFDTQSTSPAPAGAAMPQNTFDSNSFFF